MAKSLFDPDLQLVVLHPWQFLPDNLSIVRRRLGDVPPKNISYIITNDGHLRATDDPANITAPEFPIEPQQTDRVEEDRLNIWLLLINASSKFKVYQARHGLDDLAEEIREVVELTIEIVELLLLEVGPETDAELAGGARGSWSPRKFNHKDYDEGSDPGIDRDYAGSAPRRGHGGDTDRAPQQGYGGHERNQARWEVDFQARCES